VVINEVAELAFWFVRTFLNRSFDHRADGRELKEAKQLLNPMQKRGFPKVQPYTIEEVKEALFALRDGTTVVTHYKPFEEWHYQGRSIDTLGILFWKTPDKRIFIDALLEPPEPPQSYEFAEYAEWVKKYGKRALERSTWNGVFLWSTMEEPYNCERMSFAELVDIVGEDLAMQALQKWKEACDRRK